MPLGWCCPSSARRGTNRRLFGTDGVRGVVGTDLTEELVERLGAPSPAGAAAAACSSGATRGPPARRWSGRSPRADDRRLGRRPRRRASHAGGRAARGDAGAVVSASHNPPSTTAIKFFRGGWKLEDAEEEAIEALLETAGAVFPRARSRRPRARRALRRPRLRALRRAARGPARRARLRERRHVRGGPAAFERLGARVSR